LEKETLTQSQRKKKRKTEKKTYRISIKQRKNNFNRFGPTNEEML